MIFSLSVRKYFSSAFVALICRSVCLAQSEFVEVAYTPYDHQMERIQPVLSASPCYAIDEVSLTLVNEWMIELRAMPYRYSREWRTPLEVQASRVGDCKGKALALYDRLQLNGVTNVRFVIGKRRAGDSLTHAWLEWETELGTLLLDPTFNWTVTFKSPDPRRYVAFYGYEGTHKYLVPGTLFAKKGFGTRVPAAPSQGTRTRPTRSIWGSRASPWLSDEATIDARFFANRPTF